VGTKKRRVGSYFFLEIGKERKALVLFNGGGRTEGKGSNRRSRIGAGCKTKKGNRSTREEVENKKRAYCLVDGSSLSPKVGDLLMLGKNHRTGPILKLFLRKIIREGQDCDEKIRKGGGKRGGPNFRSPREKENGPGQGSYGT